jgi:hypothetical protein
MNARARDPAIVALAAYLEMEAHRQGCSFRIVGTGESVDFRGDVEISLLDLVELVRVNSPEEGRFKHR